MIEILLYILSVILSLASFAMLAIGGSSKKEMPPKSAVNEPPEVTIPYNNHPIIGRIFLLILVGGIVLMVYINFNEKEKPSSTNSLMSITKNEPTIKWETVDTFPISIEKAKLNLTQGKNGERGGTGEIWIPCILLPGWEYKLVFSGEYKKLLPHLGWRTNKWSGWINPDKNRFIPRPFQNILYGALTLRIGETDGLFPAKENSIFCQVKSPKKMFTELNIERALKEYSSKRAGTLLITIKRRRMKK